MPRISFLLPTRGKPDLAGRFLRSLRDTAHYPQEIEVILGVDADDPQSHAIACEGLAVKTLILPPGLTMGALNHACFGASTGRYVMLINDDVIVRTAGWDSTVYATLARFDDDMAMLHVNDLLFRERLCAFPILSRRACLEIGVCPTCYRRYRIDDHIGDTYRLLACLGHERRVFLPDVVFEHENYTTASAARRVAARAFTPRMARSTYWSRKLSPPTRDFAARFEERKRDTCKLARLIETQALESRQAAYETLLAKVRDPFCPVPVYGAGPAPLRAGEPVEIAQIEAFLEKTAATRHAWARNIVAAARADTVGAATLRAASPAGPPPVRPSGERVEAARRDSCPASADRTGRQMRDSEGGISPMTTILHKANSRPGTPQVSLVLLDWECRERFHTLDWLNRQDAPREAYEIVWVELYNRVAAEALRQADVVITCGQKGLYHKHQGYNIGLLHGRGAITVICDSDAIYPPGFISSILAAFQAPARGN